MTNTEKLCCVFLFLSRFSLTQFFVIDLIVNYSVIIREILRKALREQELNLFFAFNLFHIQFDIYQYAAMIHLSVCANISLIGKIERQNVGLRRLASADFPICRPRFSPISIERVVVCALKAVEPERTFRSLWSSNTCKTMHSALSNCKCEADLAELRMCVDKIRRKSLSRGEKNRFTPIVMRDVWKSIDTLTFVHLSPFFPVDHGIDVVITLSHDARVPHSIYHVS